MTSSTKNLTLKQTASLKSKQKMHTRAIFLSKNKDNDYAEDHNSKGAIT